VPLYLFGVVLIVRYVSSFWAEGEYETGFGVNVKTGFENNIPYHHCKITKLTLIAWLVKN
jgi:hypothetical protein